MQKETLQIGQKMFLLFKKYCTMYIYYSRSVKKLLGRFMKKQQTNPVEFRIEKVILRKVDKLFIKWKSYKNSFNSSIDIKDII